MKIDLAGRTAVLAGACHAIADAAATGLAANGASLSVHGEGRPAGVPDILLLSHPLDLGSHDPEPLATLARDTAAEMGRRGAGRIIHIVSAIGLVPMRRYEAASASMAAAIAGLRALAMQAAPKVLVNAVAAGFVDASDGAADPAMLSHIPLGRGGAVDEVVNAILFLSDPMNSYTTGQVLAVDGGWTTGYGRNF
ncbi:SDR family oxidoreductase [Kaistia algarum]|uniref:SDR family oxidoreductase n=1 Tax=Kaistia algarum TaxID=2083279 RepID=UPI001403C558|nr:SDR family oxidoreductase [Kaistia algarum]MCX5514265.1 SDR family oxidoreductase [Kaistia algarum]